MPQQKFSKRVTQQIKAHLVHRSAWQIYAAPYLFNALPVTVRTKRPLAQNDNSFKSTIDETVSDACLNLF